MQLYSAIVCSLRASLTLFSAIFIWRSSISTNSVKLYDGQYIDRGFLSFFCLIVAAKGSGKRQYRASYRHRYFLPAICTFLLVVDLPVLRRFRNILAMIFATPLVTLLILSLLGHFSLEKLSNSSLTINASTAIILTGLVVGIVLHLYSQKGGIKANSGPIGGKACSFRRPVSMLPVICFNVSQRMCLAVRSCIFVISAAMFAAEDRFHKLKGKKTPVFVTSISSFGYLPNIGGKEL